ncbi:hypothetical protein JT358_12395 [Micrococcales bacterium 31B]|nr:hypothetical protein [Micrococcales bacterium 31B]
MSAWYVVLSVGLGVAAVLTVVRMVIGPTILDRIVASDVLIAIVIAALVIHAAATHTTYTSPIIVALTMLGFVGSVAAARFVSKEESK